MNAPNLENTSRIYSWCINGTKYCLLQERESLITRAYNKIKNTIVYNYVDTEGRDINNVISNYLERFIPTLQDCFIIAEEFEVCFFLKINYSIKIINKLNNNLLRNTFSRDNSGRSARLIYEDYKARYTLKQIDLELKKNSEMLRLLGYSESERDEEIIHSGCELSLIKMKDNYLWRYSDIAAKTSYYTSISNTELNEKYSISIIQSKESISFLGIELPFFNSNIINFLPKRNNIEGIGIYQSETNFVVLKSKSIHTLFSTHSNADHFNDFIHNPNVNEEDMSSFFNRFTFSGIYLNSGLKSFSIIMNPKNASSKIDPRVLVSKNIFAVTLTAFNGSEGNHAHIYIEGIDVMKEGEGYAIYEAHYTYKGTVLEKLEEDNIIYDQRSIIRKVPSYKAKAMLLAIDREAKAHIKKHPRLCELGKDSLFADGDDSCITWALSKLEIIDIFIGKSMLGFILTRTKNFTYYPSEAYFSNRIFVWYDEIGRYECTENLSDFYKACEYI